MFKNKTTFYKKLMINYNIIIFIIIIGVNLLLYINFDNTISSYNKELNKNMMNSIEERITLIKTLVDNLSISIYKDTYLVEDIIYFLEHDINQYIKNKLDLFHEGDSNYYNGLEKMVHDLLEKDYLLESVEIVSYITETSYTFDRKNTVKKRIFLPELYEDSSTYFVDNYYRGYINYSKEIYDPYTSELKGAIILKIDENQLNNLLKKYEKTQRILILHDTGLILYDTRHGEEYLHDFSKILEENTNSNVTTLDIGDNMLLVGFFENENVFFSQDKVVLFVLVNICIILLAELFAIKRTNILNDRLETILEVMTTISPEGTLNKIPPEIIDGIENDEITLICKEFNNLSDNLDEYINKYYISEIKQKNAEMKALQGNINPHFLYNTLESIRMKALMNNDKEVGKMIYLLAHLFRSQLKEKDIITLKTELEYCNKFLDIYEFRYRGKINYNFQCDKELLNQPINKFILQPLIENYFMHGIRLENDNNTINININKKFEDIMISIKDNGRGIEKDILDDLNLKLINNISDNQKIGILNVNQRIKITYGDKYGLTISSKKDKGTTIFLKIPYIDNIDNIDNITEDIN